MDVYELIVFGQGLVCFVYELVELGEIIVQLGNDIVQYLFGNCWVVLIVVELQFLLVDVFEYIGFYVGV